MNTCNIKIAFANNEAKDIYISNGLGPATDGSAGADLRSMKDAIVEPGGIVEIPLGIITQFNSKWCALIQPRSGLAAKNGIGIINSPGLIDSDYRGEWKASLINHSRKAFHISKGDRIAQFRMTASPKLNLKIVDFEKLSKSKRTGGFGHTGVK